MADVQLLTVPTIQIMYPNNFANARLRGTNSEQVPLTDILRDGDDILMLSDQEVLHRAEDAFDDLARGSLDGLKVTRPQEGTILITMEFALG